MFIWRTETLLVSIILSCAKALKKSINIPPIMLLDEVFTHLDLNKKNCLFNELMSMGFSNMDYNY